MMCSVTSEFPVLIIGAGISGLALAQGLRCRSIPFRIFERHPQSRLLQGHRFRISPEGAEALQRVLPSDLYELFLHTGAKNAPFQPRYVDAKGMNFRERKRVENPNSIPIDRSLLRNVMIQGIENAIEYGRELSAYEVDATTKKITAKFHDGSEANGIALIGADGIWSRVRKQYQTHRKLINLERWITWGRTQLAEHLRENLPEDVLSWFMAIDGEANSQAVIDPMEWSEAASVEANGRLPDFRDYIYWAVATETAPRDPGTAKGRKDFLRQITNSWDPNLQIIFTQANHELSTCAPIVSSKPNIELKSSSQPATVTLIGDAAHPMSPMGGAGGDLALQGVADLLNMVDQFGITKEGIRRFEETIELRAEPKLYRSFANGKKFWKGKEWYEYDEIADRQG
ncbi:MAG: hypothetical protein M1820_008233 [Bogoriella megaspora]|nr:MAG: hypothetical protein M1820_008233 [Bogoriella megaspora]